MHAPEPAVIAASDRTEFIVAAGQYVGDRGDVEVCACDLKGKVILVIGGEYAGSEGSKLEGLFCDDAFFFFFLFHILCLYATRWVMTDLLFDLNVHI